MGLVESLAEYYPETKWQRCMVHFYRNVFSAVPRKRVKDVAAMLKAIHASEDKAAARQKAEQIIEKLESLRLKDAAKKVRESINETLTYYDFPRSHHSRIRTNNALERIMKEIRRRTEVVGAFPDGHSALMLCAARLRHIAGTKWGQKTLSEYGFTQRTGIRRDDGIGRSNLADWGAAGKKRKILYTTCCFRPWLHRLQMVSGAHGRRSLLCCSAKK